MPQLPSSSSVRRAASDAVAAEVVYNPKYEPLFRDPQPDDPRYTVITGGRGSGKSHATSGSNVVDSFRNDRNILYARYTLTSAGISVIPEYRDKIELLQKERCFRVTQDTIVNLVSGGTMYFRGILGSSGNQTARLKSIAKLRKFVLDEAQELTSESNFDIIDLSIREVDVPNKVELILNPADIHHWIYRRFFGSRGVPYDFNGRVDDTLYIHTDWRDNRANLHPSFIARALEMERTDPEKYANIYLGDWSVRRNGLIYPRWEPCALQDIPVGLEWWYANDWGYGGDPDALVRLAFDPLTRTLYCVEVMYAHGKLPRDVAAAIRRDCATVGLDPAKVVVYCDPVRPDSIDELRKQYGINALPGINRDKPGRIGYLQGFRVRYCGAAIGKEVVTYSWKPNKWDEDTFTDIPQDGNDHMMDAISYGTTHLRRLGISNDLGDLPK